MKKIAITALLVFSMMLSACGGSYAATAGKVRITEGELNFYLSNIKAQMIGTELASEEDWQTQEIEGMTAIDFAKERALETAADNVAYVEISQYLNVGLDDAEQKQISAYKNNFIRQYGGETGYKSFLKEQGITDKFIDMLCESTIYSEKLADMAEEESPATEEERARVYEKLLSAGYYNAKHILIATIDTNTMKPLSDEEKQSAKVLADEIYTRAQNGEDFDSLMTEYSQDPGLSLNPDGYVFSSGEMLPEFEACTAGLTEGAIGFCETSYGYHIIKRLPLTPDSLDEQISSQLRQDKLNDAMIAWKAEAGFTVVKNDSVFNRIS